MEGVIKMEQSLHNIKIDKQGFLYREKEYPRVIYVNMGLMIDKYMRPWVKDFEKAFKLLDKTNKYNIVILLKADGCTPDKKLIKIKNMKKIMIIDK